MIEIEVVKQADIDAEKLWCKLSNFGDMSWFPLAEKVESSGSGPGMIRRVFMPDGGYVDEKLESLDNGKRTLAYSIAKTPAFPFANYQAQVLVTGDDPIQTSIVWSCSFDAEGMPEAEAKAMIEGVYIQLIEALFASVK